MSKVLIIGPDTQGGISSVIGLYKDFNLINNDEIISLATYKSKNILNIIRFYTIFLIKYIFTFLKNRNIQLVHIHSASKGSFFRKYIAVKIAKLFKRKVFFHIHGAEFLLFYKNSPRFVKKMIEHTLNQSEAVIGLSEQWKNDLSKICPTANIKVLYNPTVIKEINNRNFDDINILFLGRLGKRKGVYDIIEAGKYLKSDNIQINLYGDGNKEEFQSLVNKYNLQDKIKVQGWISGKDKEEVIKNTDIFILPSYNEGLPMSILEAMAHGLPVISTPIAGIPEAVYDGINGFLIQPGDYRAIAEKIDILTENRELRQKMGQESYRLAKEKFDINIIIEQLKGFYEEILNQNE